MKSLILLALFSFPAFAEEGMVQVLKCPAIPESHTKLLTDLTVLKTAIKREAACQGVEQQVSSLESLLGMQRQRVADIIEKSKTQPLEEMELQIVRNYVQEVTTKALSTADLISNSNHCFAEDKKQLGFSDLAAITLDATALAKTVAGPWATPVALGGQAIAGIFQSLDKVVTSKTGYKFDQTDQRRAYVQSLCAYYNYRQDVQNLLYPEEKISELTKLERKVTEHLNNLTENCDTCRAIADKAAEPNSNTQAINELSKKANAEYVHPLGNYTVKALVSLQWMKEEKERLASNLGDGASIGKDLLAEITSDIDQFLFVRQAPEFIKYQSDKSYDLVKEFSQFVTQEGRALMVATAPIMKPNGYFAGHFYSKNEVETLAYLDEVKSTLKAQRETALYYRIVNFQRRSKDMLDRAKLSLSVKNTYCDFFQKTGVYERDLRLACEQGSSVKVQAELRRFAGDGEKLNAPLAGVRSAPAPAIVQEPEYVTDWATAIDKSVDEISESAAAFKRR